MKQSSYSKRREISQKTQDIFWEMRDMNSCDTRELTLCFGQILVDKFVCWVRFCYVYFTSIRSHRFGHYVWLCRFMILNKIQARNYLSAVVDYFLIDLRI